MRCRQVCFYVDLDDLPRMMAAIEEAVIPSFELTPNFLGVTAIKANAGSRAEVIVTSFWHLGLEGSEDEAERFVEAISRVTGRNPSRKNFDTLYAEIRDSEGGFRHERQYWNDRPRDWPSGRTGNA